VKSGHVVPEICVQADRHTNRHIHHNTPLPYRGQSNNIIVRVHASGVNISETQQRGTQTILQKMLKIFCKFVSYKFKLRNIKYHSFVIQDSHEIPYYLPNFSNFEKGQTRWLDPSLHLGTLLCILTTQK